MKMLEIISQGSTLSALASQIPKYCSTKLTNINCNDNIKFLVVTEVARRAKNGGFDIVLLDGVKIYDKENGSWVLVRASNTTPFIRVNAEGRTFQEAIKMHNYGEKLVKEVMNND
jgi:phosphomannomutase